MVVTMMFTISLRIVKYDYKSCGNESKYFIFHDIDNQKQSFNENIFIIYTHTI